MHRHLEALTIASLLAVSSAYVSVATSGQLRNSRAGSSANLRALNPDHEIGTQLDYAGVVRAMDEWVANSVAPEGYVKKNLKQKISLATSLPQVLSEFWHTVGSCIDDQRQAREDRPFRRLHILSAPYCQQLQSYETLALLDRLLARAAVLGDCRDFGATCDSGLTAYHNHPKYMNTPAPATKAYAVRHSPFPSFSIAAQYEAGGGAAGGWPWNTDVAAAAHSADAPTLLAPRVRPLPPRPLPITPKNGGSSSSSTSNSSSSSGGRSVHSSSSSSSNTGSASVLGRGTKPAPRADRDWAPRVRGVLEGVYRRAAASASDDTLAPRGAIPESSMAVLHSMQQWVAAVLREAQGQQSQAYASSAVVRRMGQVAVYRVTRSSRGEDLFADAWEAIAELCEKAADAGCAVPEDGQAPHEQPCYSSLLVAPNFDTYCSEAFRRFGDSLRCTLEHLPLEEHVTVEVFHPEFVTDLDREHDQSMLRRSPWPAIHICYEGLRSNGDAGEGSGSSSSSSDSSSDTADSSSSSSDSGGDAGAQQQ